MLVQTREEKVREMNRKEKGECRVLGKSFPHQKRDPLPPYVAFSVPSLLSGS